MDKDPTLNKMSNQRVCVGRGSELQDKCTERIIKETMEEMTPTRYQNAQTTASVMRNLEA